jgi:uncharacterized protein (TIGR02679 family)
MGECSVCGSGSGCQAGDLGDLLAPQLTWLWEQVAAAADRRGDPTLTVGVMTVRAPAEAADRAAAMGLLGGRPLAPGQSRRLDLEQLTARLQVRWPGLTPGALAAHATRRPLAVRAQAKAARAAAEADLRAQLEGTLPVGSGRPDLAAVWDRLRRSGWVARLLAADAQAVVALRAATDVLHALPAPGERADRRQLADAILDDPHGLDDGSVVAGLVLALLAALETVPGGLRPRDAWDAVGVDYDDLTGGLLTLGVTPAGWVLPAGAMTTLPPRELTRCAWEPPPATGGWVFVTENPSILGAAANLQHADPATPKRVLCTVGTPSALEVSAIARLAMTGWRVAVRADFDDAGLAHVNALLAGVPGAVPWRMGAADYERTLERSPQSPPLRLRRLPESSWDARLAGAMREAGRAGYEESLLEELLADIARGSPDPVRCASSTARA